MNPSYRLKDRPSVVLTHALVVTVMVIVAACEKAPAHVAASERSDVPARFAETQDPNIDTFLGEKRHPNEEELAQKIAVLMAQSVQEKSAKQGSAIRDAHPKAHGCVKALFHVDDPLPPGLATGVFHPGLTYDAWIRFSNSNADPDQADITGDGRGMAIKLMGIRRGEALEKESSATTQDFIMISHPVFIIDDPSDYLFFQKKTVSDHWVDTFLEPFALGIKGAWNALQITRKKIENPLQARYWSMVPSQLGVGTERQAIKFSAMPFSDPGQACPNLQDDFPSDPTPNYLRQALRNTLANEKACMQFLVQPRAPFMSVENSRDEWKEADAPFFKVATIQIPQQEFDTPEQNLYCENLSFNPWHALPEHRPLGVVNRLRRVIYPHISETRHRLNAAPRVEPQGIQWEK